MVYFHAGLETICLWEEMLVVIHRLITNYDSDDNVACNSPLSKTASFSNWSFQPGSFYLHYTILGICIKEGGVVTDTNLLCETELKWPSGRGYLEVTCMDTISH